MDQNSLMERAAVLALQKMRANQGGPFGAVIVLAVLMNSLQYGSGTRKT